MESDDSHHFESVHSDAAPDAVSQSSEEFEIPDSILRVLKPGNNYELLKDPTNTSVEAQNQ